MWKKIGKFLLTVIAIAGSALAIFTFYKKKKEKAEEENEFSDIFEEEDFDLDESL
jgi:hypothetical protein